jgi:hypothetical protein
MIKSILIGLIPPSTIIFSGWIRFLFSLISIRFGNGIPFLYFLIGVSFGIGDYYKNFNSYWVTFIAGMIFSILILKWSSNHDSKAGQISSTVSLCGSGFIIGGLLGMIIGLIF